MMPARIRRSMTLGRPIWTRPSGSGSLTRSTSQLSCPRCSPPVSLAVHPICRGTTSTGLSGTASSTRLTLHVYFPRCSVVPVRRTTAGLAVGIGATKLPPPPLGRRPVQPRHGLDCSDATQTSQPDQRRILLFPRQWVWLRDGEDGERELLSAEDVLDVVGVTSISRPGWNPEPPTGSCSNLRLCS